MIRQLVAESPLMQLIYRQSHRLSGCGLGVQKYLAHIRMSGFNVVNLLNSVSAYKAQCKLCPLVSLVLTGKSPARDLANKLTRGPDEFVPSALSHDPLSVIQCDEAGPFYLGKQGCGFVKVWVLVAVEIVTRLIYFIPLKRQDTVSFIMALEILQS